MKQRLRIPSLQDALNQLCSGKKFQSGEHIMALHSYCASRLVAEGGFPPEWVNPAPQLRSQRLSNSVYTLSPGSRAAWRSETRVLGGIKYKDVDITVMVPNVGPALAISVKNTGNAFRNLTNRMEEALGECTNIHLMYPGFVFGFLHLIKLAKLSDVEKPDASFSERGEPLPSITRYHDVLIALSGRSTITDPGMRYEAVGLLVYKCAAGKADIWHGYPPADSPVHFLKFFQRLFVMYDLRYGYPDPDGPNIRKEWRPEGIPAGLELDHSLRFPWGLRLAPR